MLFDTTLASPWYFISPASGYESFVEIRNQSSSAVNVTVRAYTPAGAVAGSTTVSLPANANTAIAISSLGVTSGSGSVTITHTGLPGSIVANSHHAKRQTGLSFDAPFTARMAWSLF